MDGHRRLAGTTTAVAVLGALLLSVAVANRSPAGARTSTQLTTTDAPTTTDAVTRATATVTTLAPVEDQPPLVVEPTHGLRDGQQLHVAIRRPPSHILVDICTTDEGDDRGCAYFPRTTRISSTYTETAVRFIVTNAGRIVDCAERKGRCVLRVYDVGDVPLEFDPSEPPPYFGYDADPTTQLENRDSVHVSGVTPSKTLVVMQCLAKRTTCVPVTGIIPANGGSFSADVAVSRALVGPERDHDCASEACELMLLDSLHDGPVLARFNLSFSATEPFARSSVRLESGTLHDRDSVTVRGSELVAGAFVSVQVCGTLGTVMAGVPSSICENRMYNATIDQRGAFSVAVALRERTTGYRLATGNVEFVCVGQPCTVVVNVNHVRSYVFRFQFGDDGIAELEGDSQ